MDKFSLVSSKMLSGRSFSWEPFPMSPNSFNQSATGFVLTAKEKEGSSGNSSCKAVSIETEGIAVAWAHEHTLVLQNPKFSTN